MIEKTLRMNYLYDFYQKLLTTKQSKYMELYYLDDWSLGEIAEEFDVSRQAVYDNIKRTEAMLEEYESKLGLFSKFDERTKFLNELRVMIENGVAPEKVFQLIESLEKLD